MVPLQMHLGSQGHAYFLEPIDAALAFPSECVLPDSSFAICYFFLQFRVDGRKSGEGRMDGYACQALPHIMLVSGCRVKRSEPVRPLTTRSSPSMRPCLYLSFSVFLTAEVACATRQKPPGVAFVTCHTVTETTT
eukprot:363223-Chlamydomonas_euryale.AAC.3